MTAHYQLDPEEYSDALRQALNARNRGASLDDAINEGTKRAHLYAEEERLHDAIEEARGVLAVQTDSRLVAEGRRALALAEARYRRIRGDLGSS